MNISTDKQGCVDGNSTKGIKFISIDGNIKYIPPVKDFERAIQEAHFERHLYLNVIIHTLDRVAIGWIHRLWLSVVSPCWKLVGVRADFEENRLCAISPIYKFVCSVGLKMHLESYKLMPSSSHRIVFEPFSLQRYYQYPNTIQVQ